MTDDQQARNELLDGLSADVRALTVATERLAGEYLANPVVTCEGGDIGFGIGPGYQGLVFVITPLEGRVRLGIPYGADLDDPGNLLEGAGRRHRYLAIRRAEDLERPRVRSLLGMATDAAVARNARS